jgi:hypothetical protein
MSATQTVTFEKPEAAQRPSDQEIERRIATGRVSNTAMSIHQARKQGLAGMPAAPLKLEGRSLSFDLDDKAIEVSDPTLDRSDETAVAINPGDRRNIVAGAASFDGSQFVNTAYVTKDGGKTWKTVIALKNTDEGAGIAFDDSGNWLQLGLPAREKA